MIDRKAVALLGCALLMLSCTKSHNPGDDGQMRFLTRCDKASDCGELDCICGVCTKTCSSNKGCAKLGEGAACLEPDQLGARECGIGMSEPVDQSVCDTTCTEESGCNSLGDAHACNTGYCRAPRVEPVSLDEPLCPNEPPSQSTCLVSGVTAEIDVKKVEKVDLLFVIDNSGSMEEEQQKLRDELPRMITILTTGDLNPEDGIQENADFPAAKDLNLAVVTTDMGLPGAKKSIDPENKCKPNLGDDGLFQWAGNQAKDSNLSCVPEYPIILSFKRGDDPAVIASQFQCVTALGTGGCGFEMQLEAGLKALWPANPDNMDESQKSLNVSFFGNTPAHGDQEHVEFLRGTTYHPTESEALSLLAVIVVTDEEDCSAGANGNLDFLEHKLTAPPGIAEQPANLRCYYDTVNNQGNKFPVQRYVDALKALRPGYQQLVVFAAIAGIPPDIKQADFDMDADGLISQSERDAFYQALLSDPLMQEVIREPDRQNLEPSCTLRNELFDPNNPNMTEKDRYITKALPPRRIAEVAQGFGENGVIESICQENFTGAMDSIIEAISKQLGEVCLPRKLKRDSDGLVECDVVWAMPGGRDCGELDFLSPPPAGRPQKTKDDRNLCVVNQVPVIDPTQDDPQLALQSNVQGWYYDDFSADRLKQCKGDHKQRIALTRFSGEAGEVTADPPAGVTVELRCLNELQSIVDAEQTAAEKVGYECNVDQECGSRPMRCHAKERTCVIACASNDDCPNAWICDSDSSSAQTAGFSLCVNPICELPEGEARNCGNSDVGNTCIPQNIPADGFKETEVFLETNSPDCETRICGVFKYAGDPRRDDPPKVQDYIYCTCRCDAGDESIDTCSCPEGFQCVDALGIGGPGIRGSYCVRKGTW